MKKLSLLLAALTMAFAASAITPIHSSNMTELKTKKQVRSLVKQETPRMGDVVTQQPEGTLVLLKRGTTGGSLYVSSGSIYNGYQSGNVMAVISDDGKTMWIKDIISSLALDSWVYGELSEDGTTLTVPMGQPIYVQDGTEILLGWTQSQVVYDEEGNANLDVALIERETEAVFAIDGDVLTLLNSQGATEITGQDLAEYEATGLGVYDMESGEPYAYAYIDWNTTFTNNGPINVLPVITEQPEGELVTYVRSGQTLGLESVLWFTFVSLMDQGGKVDVVYAPDGKTVYIKDIMYGYEINTWVKGELDEQGLIHVPAGQCIYWSDQYMGGVVLTMGHVGATLDAEGFEIAEPIDDEILFQVDGETITLVGSSADVDDDYYYVTGLTGFWTDDDSNLGSIDWNTTLNELHLEPAVPANPEAIDWDDKGNENGNNRFYFNIKLEDVDGNALDADHVYYSVYTDNDEIFTFDAATYGSSGLTEDMTEVPYSIQNYDLHPESGYVYMYRTNADGFETFFNERIGIQVHYIVDGVKNSSDIVYWYLPTPPEKAATPADPVIVNWHDSGDVQGYSYLQFELPTVDTEGNPLVQEYLSYSIYTDNDELFVFDAYTYSDLNEDMEAIPYEIWSNGWDFYSSRVYFYYTNEGDNPLFYDRIGIQVHYTTGEGVFSSNIVYIDKHTAVNELNAGKTVANVRYFNIAGQEMAQPQGMTIQVTTYTDGTTSTAKVVK